MTLRQEAYGGLLFHPDEGVFVELDHEAFEAAKRFALRGGSVRRPSEWLVKRTLRSIVGDMDRPTRVILNDSQDLTRELSVLEAPTLIDFQITERCGLGCPQCYASSLPNGIDVSWEDAELAAKYMQEAGVLQVAIGGGEPLYHPRFKDLLALFSDHGLVPNLTTTGLGMKAHDLAAMKRYTGAVAMSLEGVGDKFSLRRRQGFTVFRKTAERFLDAGIPLVMQVTVSATNLPDIPEIVEFCRDIGPLYGVVFLNYKPAGRGESYDKPLSSLSYAEVHRILTHAVRELHPVTRVGFDCCFTPGLSGIETSLSFKPGTILEGCSATRSGLGLSPHLDVLPCTFLPDKKLGNLKEKSLKEIWHDRRAQSFRGAMVAHKAKDSRCGSCAVSSHCLGGCSVWNLVGCQTKEPLAL